MSIEFHCADCSKLLRVADGLGGKRCKCPSCNSVQTVPIQSEVQQAIKVPSAKNHASASDQPPKPSAVDESVEIKVEIACPKCNSLLLYSPELEGTRGLCKACQHIFTISVHNQAGTQSDTFAFQCPKCSFLFEGKKEMDGKKGKCTECKEVFIIRPMKKDSSSKESSVPSNVPQFTALEAPQLRATASPKLFNPLKPASDAQTRATPSSPTASDPLFLETLEEPGRPTEMPIVVKPIPVESQAATPHARVVQAQLVTVVPTATPNTAKPATSKTAAVKPAVPLVPPTANPTANPSLEAVWDQIEVPTPDWTTATSSDRNPYAPPSGYSSNSTRSYGRSLTVTNCLKMVQERIWPILRWSLIPTMMMIGIAIAESVIAFVGIMILGAIGVATQDASGANVAVGLALIMGMAIGALLFAIPYLLVLPSYWQIALDGILGRRLTIDVIQKGMKWSGWLFLCFFAVFLLRFVANLVVGGIGGLVMIESKEAEPFVRMVSGVIGLCIGIITLPVQLLPFALADGFPVGHAIHVAFRYVFGHFWRFVGLSILASLIFWAPGVLIFAIGAIVFAITGAGSGSAIGAIVFALAMVMAGLVAVFFFPGFYACYAAFYVLAKENDR
jgi:phage FluMu protein Com